MNDAPAYRRGPEHRLGDSAVIAEHRILAPLDHANPDGEQIEVFAREYRSTRAGAETLPWLLYLQGGPGCAGTRHLSLSGWIGEASKHFRILMLDQRGTGRSAPVNRNTVSGTDQEIADRLRHMRADSIVRDAELFRGALGVERWHTHGQSYGGFITATYLSLHPESLAGSMITGGLPPLTVGVDDVYRATYDAVARREREFFSWYPEDEEVHADIVARVRTGKETVDGVVLRPGHLQRLGMFLGGNTRVHGLHYALSEAFERRADGELGLTDSFKRTVWNQFHQEATPLYTVMHETIYAEGTPTNWAAWRVGAELPRFAEDAERPALTGEMIYPWHVETDPATAPLWGAASLLAEADDFGPLYDRTRLASNEVPVAACVYTDDIYVERGVSLASAEAIAGTQVYERSDLHHDGIAQDGPTIFRELARRVGALPEG
ncbi:alpha/beta fold hydrolase [Falsarthrobacter nasiphocae]|uniref:Proline iminopeptidase n=1 Tax=Falsarthrobacter nasiphocae TaxID=189863 RepID=A0AAE4C4A7_9MICC|nr:alpha/beta fold hydrolase [Falsarthrobacter nasiphocae]MDR6891171.1 proline iminopeptidase [Falsarthrobacter nasiphocae]